MRTLKSRLGLTWPRPNMFSYSEILKGRIEDCFLPRESSGSGILPGKTGVAPTPWTGVSEGVRACEPVIGILISVRFGIV